MRDISPTPTDSVRAAPLRTRRSVLPHLAAALVAALAVATQYALPAVRRVLSPKTLGTPLATPTPNIRDGWEHASTVVMALMMGAAVLLVVVRPTHWRWGVWCVIGAVTVGALRTQSALYNPVSIVGWTVRASHQPTLAMALHGSGLVFLGTLAVGLVLLLALTTPTASETRSHAHGSAAWGTGATLRSPTGVWLGRHGKQILRYDGDGHLVTLAPTRSGKGVSVAIPNLLTYPGSVVVTDPKGELVAVTGRRRVALQSRVVVLAPFGIATHPHQEVASGAFNPLDALDSKSADVLDDARLLADMLVVIDGPEHGEQAFWNEEARALLAGLILYVVADEPPERKTLTHVRTLLTLPPALFEELLARMSQSSHVDGLVARSAARLLQKAEKERSGVISAAQSHTHFLDSAHIGQVVSHSTFDLADLKRQCVSLYLVLPPDRLDTYHRWLRLMIGMALRAMTRTPGLPPYRVLFLLDEFGHLGRMRPVERDISLVGGYGARLWLLVQSLSQLKTIYGQAWPTFLANADVLQTFGVRDWETAEHLSKLTGDATVTTDSENRSRGVSRGKYGSQQEGTAETRAERGRRLLLPDEVRRMPRDTQLLFVANQNPVWCQRLDYRHDATLRAHADPNPLFAPPAVGGSARVFP